MATIAAVTAGSLIDPTTFGNAVVDQLNSANTAAAWTVTITQGVTPTKTTTHSYQHKFGKIVHCHFSVAFTSAGTAATAILVTLPSTSTSAASVGGSFSYFDSGTTRIQGTIEGASTSQAQFVILSAGLFGTGTTIANADTMTADIWYVEP